MSYFHETNQRFSSNAPTYNPFLPVKSVVYFEEGKEIVKKVTAKSQKVWLHLDTLTLIIPTPSTAKKWDKIVKAEMDLFAFLNLHRMFTLPVMLKLVSFEINAAKNISYAYPCLSALAHENTYILDPQNDRHSTWKIHNVKLGLTTSSDPGAIIDSVFSELITDLAKIVLFNLPLKNDNFLLVLEKGKVRFMGVNCVQKSDDVPTKVKKPDEKLIKPALTGILHKIFEMVLTCELNTFALADRETMNLFAIEYAEKVIEKAKKLYDSEPIANSI